MAKQFTLTPTGGTSGNILKIIVVLVVCLVVYQLYKTIKGASNVVGDALGVKILSDQTGISPARINTCKEVADKVYKALYKYYGGMAEDEEAVIVALNQLREAKEAAYCSVYYHQTYDKGLKADMQYLSTSEQARITPIILHNLN